MAAATVSVTKAGRAGGLGGVSVIQLSIVFSGTTYTNGTGIAFDLATALNNVLGNLEDPVNVNDVLNYQLGLTTGGYLATQFTVGTATFTTNTDSSSARSQNISYATCPCTVKLFGTGSGNQAALAEIATGTVTDTLNIALLVSRGGGSL